MGREAPPPRQWLWYAVRVRVGAFPQAVSDEQGHSRRTRLIATDA
jgi:hypothetical protein